VIEKKHQQETLLLQSKMNQIQGKNEKVQDSQFLVTNLEKSIINHQKVRSIAKRVDVLLIVIAAVSFLLGHSWSIYLIIIAVANILYHQSIY